MIINAPRSFSLVTFKCPRSDLQSLNQNKNTSPASSRRCMYAVAAANIATSKIIKICGVTTPEDAILAASSGANYIGMILWPKAKRSIPTDTAQAIAAAARQHNAIPVGVFVDEDAETIVRVCKDAKVDVAQLHGDGARRSLLHLPPSLSVIYVMHADVHGNLCTPLPSELLPSTLSDSPKRQEMPLVDYILLDSLQGGSGEKFDWNAVTPPPTQETRRGWLLAGGLSPDNVSNAVRIALPNGVDVSSGVCGPDGLRKDENKVKGYIQNARYAFED